MKGGREREGRRERKGGRVRAERRRAKMERARERKKGGMDLLVFLS